MNHHDLPIVTLPADLDDRAAAELLDFLNQLARVLEQHYAEPLRRYRDQPDRRQLPLWDDPPF